MTTTGSKFFTCIYSILGILNLALAVSLTRETVIEALQASYRKRMNAVRDRRKIIRWARRVGRRWIGAVSWRLREGGKDIWVWTDELELSTQNDDSEARGSIQKFWNMLLKSCRFFRISIVQLADRILPYQGTWEPSEKSPLWDMPHPHGMHLNLEALTESQLEAAAMEAGVPLVELVPEKFWEKREKRLRKEREKKEKRRHREKEKGSEQEKGTEDEKQPLSQWDPHSSSSRTTSSSTRTPQQPSHQHSDSSTTAHSHWFDRLKRVQHDIDPEEVPLSHARLGRMIGMLGAFGMAFSLDARKSHVTEKSGPSSTSTTKRSPCDGFDFDAAFRQKKLKEEATSEERKAFYAQLSVVLTLFLVFWMVFSIAYILHDPYISPRYALPL
jgi:potassium channel subfamily K, other eukaryote